jgi:hypothetical protein
MRLLRVITSTSSMFKAFMYWLHCLVLPGGEEFLVREPREIGWSVLLWRECTEYSRMTLTVRTNCARQFTSSLYRALMDWSGLFCSLLIVFCAPSYHFVVIPLDHQFNLCGRETWLWNHLLYRILFKFQAGSSAPLFSFGASLFASTIQYWMTNKSLLLPYVFQQTQQPWRAKTL